MTPRSFSDLRLIEPLLRALRAKSYTVPTPIQADAIPPLLEGRDLLGIAQTGTGKTAAFALPILQRLASAPDASRAPRALILAPTRELAAQIGASLRAYGQHLRLRSAVIFGGVSQHPQTQALLAGVDVLVATPGRLLDLLAQRYVDLRRIQILVIDEADRMLDFGFIPAVRKLIAALPATRQSLLFSATMPGDVVALAKGILRDPVRIDVSGPAPKAQHRIAQHVIHVAKADKRALLAEILRDPAFERTLVFTRTRHGADRVVRHLRREGVHAEAIHGDKKQSTRERVLAEFRSGTTGVLVATEIAARGIDVPNVTHVINFDLPNVAESYVHRIGRTGRAGREGVAISFCDPDEREYLRDIERLIGRPVPVMARAGGARASTTRTRAPVRAHPVGRHEPQAAPQRSPQWPQGQRPQGVGERRRFARSSDLNRGGRANTSSRSSSGTPVSS